MLYPKLPLAALAAATVLTLGATAAAAPLSGTVVDGASFEPVTGATVTEAGGQRAVTGPDGKFRFADLPAGVVRLRIEAAGFDPADEVVELGAAGLDEVVFLLLPPGAFGEIIEITEHAPLPTVAPGQQDLRREELTRIPGARGDALTSLKSMPGVANVDAFGSGPGLLVIRGAAPEDSKVSIDGIEVPLLYHFFGLQSILPSEFIDSIDFLPGGFGVEEGRATGGVINVLTRSDHHEELGGFAELSFINLAALIQGPISRSRDLQFAAGLRRSTIDFILPAVLPKNSNLAFTTAPQYYDGQLRVDWRPNHRNRVSVLGLASFDLLRLISDDVNPNEPLLTGKFENETSFTRVIATWRHAADGLENRLVASAGTTGFRVEIGADRYLHASELTLELRDDLTYRVSPRITVRAGAEARHRTGDLDIRFPLPPAEGSGGIPNFSASPVIELRDSIALHAAAAYLTTDVQPTTTTTVTPGVRLDYYDRLRAVTVSPRVSVRQQLGDDLTLRAALGAYSRPLEQVEALQTELSPELATQYVLGADYRLAPGVSASMSGFYTDRRQLVVQDSARAAMDPSAAYVNRGYGRSAGVEALVRVKRDDFFGWIAYTLSRSDRVDAPLAERRVLDYDQTHNLIAVASYRLGRWELGGRWRFNTGNPITPVLGAIYLADLDIYLPVLGELNSARYEPAHQLDVRVDRRWTFRTWSLAAYLDVTNVYVNPRTLAYRYSFDYSEREPVQELPLVPALGLRGTF